MVKERLPSLDLMARPKTMLLLSAAERDLLVRWRRSVRTEQTANLTRSERDVVARRARIILEDAKGLPHSIVAKRSSVSIGTVIKWRTRLLVLGPVGLLQAGRQRSGKPVSANLARAIASRLSHASTRAIATVLAVSQSTVARHRRISRT